VRLTFGLLAILLFLAPAYPQAQAPSIADQLVVNRVVCPGDPSGNLASVNCYYTMQLRLTDFVSGSITDQALLGAGFYGSFAELLKDPPEWKRTWGGEGYRVGSRYAQNLTKGLTEFTFGAIMHTDPRHVSYASDPRVKVHKSGVGPRIGHAFTDWLTVRRSSEKGDGAALPNLPLFAGAAASGFIGNIWYPDRLTTPGQALLRGSSSLATDLAYSFYTEFSPEIGRLLGAIFKRRPAATKP
jgi:hypothetical protein